MLGGQGPEIKPCSYWRQGSTTKTGTHPQLCKGQIIRNKRKEALTQCTQRKGSKTCLSQLWHWVERVKKNTKPALQSFIRDQNPGKFWIWIHTPPPRGDLKGSLGCLSLKWTSLLRPPGSWQKRGSLEACMTIQALKKFHRLSNQEKHHSQKRTSKHRRKQT